MIEVLSVVVILVILVAIALPWYWRAVEKARSSEALITLSAIRQGQLLHRAKTGSFVDAPDLASLKAALDLDLAARDFDYEIAEATDSAFLAVATRRVPTERALKITMDETGQLTYYWPEGGVAGPPVVGGGGGSGGGGLGGGGLGGGGGFGGGGGTGGGGGGGAGGGGGGRTVAGGGIPIPRPPEVTEPPVPPIPPVPPSPGSFTYITRGSDVWTSWPDLQTPTPNITGTVGVELLKRAFDLVATSEASFVTDDLARKGIPISFGDASDFPLGPFDAIAFFSGSGETFPSAPDPLPVIKFNPFYLDEDPGILAGVLVHEGTHFLQYLDLTIFAPYLDPAVTVVDVELVAW